VIVLDASVALDWLLQTSAGRRIEERIYSRKESLHAPHLIDLEIAQVLRRLGVADPDSLAMQLMLLVDGAIAAAVVRGDPKVARAAREAAATLLSAAGVDIAAECPAPTGQTSRDAGRKPRRRSGK